MTALAPEPADRAIARILAGGLNDPNGQITQTILAGDPSGIPGNCLQAAVASLLRLPLDDVPHFTLVDDWLSHLVAWAALNGWIVRYRPPVERAALAIATGPSPRGVSHAVVMRDGQIVWDPHPSRDGLTRIAQVWQFTPVNPDDPEHREALTAAAVRLTELGVRTDS